MPRRFALRALSLLLVVLWLISGPTPKESSQAAAVKTLNVALGGFPASMALGQLNGPSIMLNSQWTDPLIRRDSQGKLVPGLSESWRLVDDTTWEFKLRKGVKFHNGEPFNAAAVKFAFERILDPKQNYGLKVRLGSLNGVQVVDEYTVRLTTASPFPLLPFGMFQILMGPPPGYFKQVGEEGIIQRPVGTGAWRVVEFQPNKHLILEANPDFWDGRPKMDRAVIRHIPESSTRLAALKAGEVVLVDAVPIDLVPSITRGDFKVVSGKIPGGVVLTFNLLDEGPVKDRRVRQAIDYAIDREAIFKNVLKGYGAILDGQIPSKGTVGYNPRLKATPYDPKEAKKLLEEAGYGSGLSITLNGPSGTFPGDSEILLLVSAQLRKVGIDAKVNIMEYAVYASARSKNPRPLKDMYIVNWYHLGDAELALGWYDKSAPTVLWDNQEYFEVFGKARTTMKPAERERLLRRAVDIMNRELPSLFLFQLSQLYGVHKSVKGWQPRFDEQIGWLYKVEIQ